MAEKMKEVVKKKKWVIFNSDASPGGTEPISGSVNGNAYHFPRDTAVKLPEFILKSIDDAVFDVPFKDPKTGDVVTKSQKRFAYSEISEDKVPKDILELNNKHEAELKTKVK